MDEDGLVHWPALFFYPEAAMQHDVVDDVCEEDTFRCARSAACPHTLHGRVARLNQVDVLGLVPRRLP